ncbi:MAG: TlpA disulfide reductase family protein [Gammaproteobacteria bacterium]
MKRPSHVPLAASFVLLAACLVARPVPAASVLSDEQRFSAVDTQGQKIDLSELLQTHRAVLVNFWATWCALCKEEIPELTKLYSAHRRDGIAIIGVNVAESPRKVQAYAKKLGVNYPVVLDRESEIAETWNVVGLPLSILVRADGSLAGPYSGWTQELQRDVEAALTQ